jgi:hypothetical protein
MALAVVSIPFFAAGCGEDRPPLGEGRYESQYVPKPPAPPPPASEIDEQFRDALAHRDQLVRAERLAGLLRSATPEHLEDIRSAYDATFVDHGEIELTLFIDWWAGFDPRGAFDWIFDNWIGRHRSVVKVLMRRWARDDLESAKVAVLELNPMGLMSSAIEGLVRGWDESGEEGLLDYVIGTQNMTDRQRSITVMARRRVLEYGIDEAIVWAEGIVDAEKLGDMVKQQVLQRVATAAAEVDPVRAAAFAERHHGKRYEFGMVRRVATRWVPLDPLPAIEWLAGLPLDKETRLAVAHAYRSWFGGRRSEAIAWLLERENSLEPWMDPIVVHYVLAVLPSDPGEAMPWIDKMTDREFAHETHLKLARSWHLRDKAAAKDWIAAQDFTADEIRRIHLPAPGARRNKRPAPAAEAADENDAESDEAEPSA